MIELLILAAAIALLGLMLAIVLVLVRELGRQQPRRALIRKSAALAPTPPTDLQRQLIRLCGGDRGTAERLAALERGDWQAAIDRLLRDRH